MKDISNRAYKAQSAGFDITDMSRAEIRCLFSDLNTISLTHWMNHYSAKEEYEVCQVLKEMIDEANS